MNYTNTQIFRFNKYLVLNDIYNKYRLNKKYTFFACLEYYGFTNPEKICENIIKSKNKSGSLILGSTQEFTVNWVVVKDDHKNRIVKLFYDKKVYAFNIKLCYIEIYEAKSSTDYMIYKYGKDMSTMQLISNGEPVDNRIISCCLDDYIDELDN